MLKRKKKNCTYLVLDFGIADEGVEDPKQKVMVEMGKFGWKSKQAKRLALGKISAREDCETSNVRGLVTTEIGICLM